MKRTVLMLTIVVAVLGATVAAGAAVRGANGVNITGCVDDETGEIDQVRLFGNRPLDGECGEGETQVTWRAGRGARGPQGPPGPEGPQGPPGPSGGGGAVIPLNPTYMNYAFAYAPTSRGVGLGATAYCDRGDWATGGGFYGSGVVYSRPVFEPRFNSSTSTRVNGTVAGPIFPIGWEAWWEGPEPDQRGNGSPEVFVICQDIAPLHQVDD